MRSPREFPKHAQSHLSKILIQQRRILLRLHILILWSSLAVMTIFLEGRISKDMIRCSCSFPILSAFLLVIRSKLESSFQISISPPFERVKRRLKYDLMSISSLRSQDLTHWALLLVNYTTFIFSSLQILIRAKLFAGEVKELDRN